METSMDVTTRKFTNLVLNAVDEGWLDRDFVIMACLKYMSEDDVKDMCEAIEFFAEDEEDDEVD